VSQNPRPRGMMSLNLITHW